MATMRFGTHPLLEAEANRLLRESMKHITSHAAKSDILTPWKQQERYRREVYVETGRPDGNVRRGLFGRRANPARPDLNSREGVVPSRPRGLGSLAAFTEEHGGGRSMDGGGFG
jgi:hypothetical protein